VTKDNQRSNAQAELVRAQATLLEARTLAAASLPYGAASRAYYAVFHAVRALLFSVGLEVRSHRDAFNLLAEHFVRPGLLTTDLARLAAHLQRDREDADYMTAAVIADGEAAAMVADAERFIEAAHQLLTRPA
jgi:uncharacterized protein (UPF0332 family)